MTASGVALVTVVTLICCPPLRRLGEWTDERRQPVPRQVANRFDRFEFGYLPSFQFVSNVGRVERVKAVSQVTLNGDGPYRYSQYCWSPDWLWIALLSLPAVIFAGLPCLSRTMLEWMDLTD